MKKQRYKIYNLECANCVAGLENALNKNKKIANAVINLSASSISFESDEINLEEINKLARAIEPGVKIVPKTETQVNKEYSYSILIIGLILAFVGIFLSLSYKLNLIITICSYIVFLYRPFINALKTLKNSKSINENMLITISCIGALLVNEAMEGIMVVALYTIGKILEEKAINNTRKAIGSLLDIKQDFANIKDGKEITITDVEEIKINDILIVKKGERIPVDGIITFGNTLLDTSALTGESEDIQVIEGDKVLSGSINNGDVIEIKATNIFADSTVSKILTLVEEATDKKAKTETMVSKLSRIYTPAVLIIATLVAIFLPIIININYSESIYRGLTFLVISCPCAIAISVPLSYFTGIGVSSKNGILIKGSNYLDSLKDIKKIIFDKTGTLTDGQFSVIDIDIFNEKYTKEGLVEIIVAGESLSNHPIAKSLVKLSKEKIDNSKVKSFKEFTGKGISFKLDSNTIKIGTSDFCETSKNKDTNVVINDQYIAKIKIDDGIKHNAKEVIKALKKLDIKSYMFTGDKKEVALEIAGRLDIEARYEMLPDEKCSAYEEIKDSDIVAFVGDGINDAPTLKRADIGISMGSIGSASAIEASDIVLMSDDLSKIPKAIEISKYTNYIIKQNLIFALGLKFIILILSIFGQASMWMAVFADTGVTLITILNTLRIMRKFK